MKIEEYSAYRDSEVEWLGDVPEHWRVYQFKRIAFYQEGPGLRNWQFKDNGVKVICVTNITPPNITFEKLEKYISLEEYEQSYKHFTVKKNDLLLASSGASWGKVSTYDLDEKVILNTSTIRIHASRKTITFTHFIRWVLQSGYIYDSLITLLTGSCQPNFGPSHLSRLYVPLPLVPEQKTIAHYLDTKTTQIDRKIDLLAQKATRYSKLKQSLINETVTCGLDKSVPMKDSGIEWLGKIPAHWETRRIKEVAYINQKCLTEKTPNDYEFDYIDIGSVTYGTRGFSSERITFEHAPSRAKRIVKKGDTIISTVRTYLKAITSIDNDVSNLIVSTGFAVISPGKILLSKYFAYQAISSFIIDKVCAMSTGVSYPATNSSVIADLLCLIPPPSEQKAIADYLDTKTAQIDQIIQTINTQIERLKELRKTLISDVVTGKIKVV